MLLVLCNLGPLRFVLSGFGPRKVYTANAGCRRAVRSSLVSQSRPQQEYSTSNWQDFTRLIFRLAVYKDTSKHQKLGCSALLWVLVARARIIASLDQ